MLYHAEGNVVVYLARLANGNLRPQATGLEVGTLPGGFVVQALYQGGGGEAEPLVGEEQIAVEGVFRAEVDVVVQLAFDDEAGAGAGLDHGPPG